MDQEGYAMDEATTRWVSISTWQMSVNDEDGTAI
jgi:hypothetical protein